MLPRIRGLLRRFAVLSTARGAALHGTHKTGVGQFGLGLLRLAADNDRPNLQHTARVPV